MIGASVSLPPRARRERASDRNPPGDRDRMDADRPVDLLDRLDHMDAGERQSKGRAHALDCGAQQITNFRSMGGANRASPQKTGENTASWRMSRNCVLE